MKRDLAPPVCANLLTFELFLTRSLGSTMPRSDEQFRPMTLGNMRSLSPGVCVIAPQKPAESGVPARLGLGSGRWRLTRRRKRREGARAIDQRGISESLLRTYAFTRRMLANLVSTGFATAQRQTVKAGGKTMAVYEG
jgi:hypothetical protein